MKVLSAEAGWVGKASCMYYPEDVVAKLTARTSGRLAITLLCLLAGRAVWGDEPFRCGGKLIDASMSRAAVQALCGEPTSKSVEIQDVRSGSRVVGTTTIERWTYAAYSATRVLVFDQDTLKAIE